MKQVKLFHLFSLWSGGKGFSYVTFHHKYLYKRLKMLQVTEKIIYFATLNNMPMCQCANMPMRIGRLHGMVLIGILAN